MIYNGSLQIQDALQRATVDSKSQVGSIFQVLNTKESPPTYFQTNKFTSAFQEIVDAYGYVFLLLLQPLPHPSYGELNSTVQLTLAIIYYIDSFPEKHEIYLFTLKVLEKCTSSL